MSAFSIVIVFNIVHVLKGIPQHPLAYSFDEVNPCQKLCTRNRYQTTKIVAKLSKLRDPEKIRPEVMCNQEFRRLAVFLVFLQLSAGPRCPSM